MIKAVIFDMDGVLIEAKDWHYEALNKALNLFGFNISRFDHLTKFDGLPTKDKLNILTTEYSLPIELHSFINEMKQNYTMEIVHTKCKPLFIHEYALSKLKMEGYKLAVASNSIKNTIITMMEKAALSNYLEIMLSNEDVVKGKPDPEIYTKTINLLGLTPEECVVVEDNENGIRAAKAAGAHVLIVNEVTDVIYRNIRQFIDSVEEKKA
ncbi:HAD family hydrolase [Pantoea sp. C3]|uniref:HAD family hydrolase n=1 Tax=Pantoea phytostimulans TaxID=2769024 RepID=UPI0038F66232